MSDCMPIILEQLSSGRSVSFTAHGTSMLPLLHDSEVTISPKPDRLRVGDMPLYVRANGVYVLHRVVRINRDGSYAMCGDNQFQIETPILHKQVIGVVSCFDWNGEKTACDNQRYLKYVKKRLRILPLKRGYYALRRFAGRILRKLRLKK